MDRIDGKGFHPTARPYRPHWKRERSKLKATKIALSITKQLEVLWTKFGAFATENGERVLNKVIDLVVLDTNETYKEPMCGGDITWGAAGDFSMQHADPSRPPPKGWMQKFMRYAAVLFVGALMTFLIAACHKDPIPTPQPTPNQPTDTIPPVVPTKIITINWDWDANLGWAPPKDSIKYYTDQDSVKFVYIHIMGNWGPDFPVNCGGVRPSSFHKARDTLQTRINIDPAEVKLSGTILVNPDNGATLQSHENTQEMGMTYYDSIWFTTNGCTVCRPIYSK